MTESDRVFNAFRNCVTEPECKDCPWSECDILKNGHVEVPKDLALAIIRELKAHEPRVMTLEEVLDLQFDDVVYVQSKATGAVMSAIVVAVFPELPDIDIGVIQLRQAGGYNGTYNTELGYYGKTWRCWTAKPSEEQRRETAWE